MADENNLNELKSLMQQIAKSTKSMADDIQTQTSAQEKILLDKAAKEDAKRTEAFHKEQQKKLEGLNEVQEENKSIDEQNLEILNKILDSQNKSIKAEATANDYLQTLAKITAKNNDALDRLTDPSLAVDDRPRGFLGGTANTLARTQEFFKPATRSGLGLIGDIAGIGSNLFAAGKVAKEGLSDFVSGSGRRQKRIKSNQKELRDQQIALSAEKFELEEARKSGDKTRIKKAESAVKETEGEVKRIGGDLSKDTTAEYMRQQRKNDPSFLSGFDNKTMSLIKNQQQNNILASILKASGISSPKPDVKKDSKPTDTVKQASGMLTAGAAKSMGSQAKFQAEEAKDKRSEMAGDLFMETPISPSGSPSNYGEYVASTYEQLESINEKISNGLGGNKGGKEGQGSGFLSGVGGFFSGMLLRFKKIGKFFSKMGGKLMTQMKKIPGILKKGASKLKSFATNIGSKIKSLSSKAFSGIKSFAGKAFSGIKSFAGKAFSGLKSFAGKAAGGIKSVAGKAFSGIKSFVTKSGGAKAVGKTVGKAAGKSALKKIPILGALAGLGFGISRAMDGDWAGAGLEVLSGGASIIPGLGTAASLGIDSALLARDMGAFGGVPNKKGKLETSALSDMEQPTYMPQSSVSMSADTTSTAKVAEYQLLAKMIAKENLVVQKSDTARDIARENARLNAEETSSVFKG